MEFRSRPATIAAASRKDQSIAVRSPVDPGHRHRAVGHVGRRRQGQVHEGRGEDVIGFGAGEPDFPTPAHIVEAARVAAQDPAAHHYSATPGLPALRQAIADKTLRDSGYEVGPAQVVVTNGGKQAFYEAIESIINPGDEVLLPAPYWTTYPEPIALAGGTSVVLPTDEAAGFRVTVDQLEAARTERTKALLFVSPSNPSGAVYPRAEVEAIGRWAVEHGLWVITDEIYEHLTYDDNDFTSLPVVVPEAADQTIVLNGVAKTYAMTGWRVGLDHRPARPGRGRLHAPVPPLRRNVANVSQRATLAALDGDLDDVAMMRTEYDRRGKLIHRLLNEIDGVSCMLPQGAFYAYPSFGVCSGVELAGQTPTTTLALADMILAEAKVAFVPGEAFGSPGYGRFSFALDRRRHAGRHPPHRRVPGVTPLDRTTPYGAWSSPITTDLLVAGAVGLHEVQADGEDLWWDEGRPKEGGRIQLVRRTPDGATTDVLPDGFAARTRVHEYGGGGWRVHEGVLFFSNWSDQRLHRLDPGVEPRPLTPEGCRYADMDVAPDGTWLVAVREDHRGEGEARNEIVRIDTTTGDETVLVTGPDFVASPRLTDWHVVRLAWTQWNHPDMPWDAAEVWTGVLDGTELTEAQRLAGGADEWASQPVWAGGRLWLTSDRDDVAGGTPCGSLRSIAGTAAPSSRSRTTRTATSPRPPGCSGCPRSCRMPRIRRNPAGRSGHRFPTPAPSPGRPTARQW